VDEPELQKIKTRAALSRGAVVAAGRAIAEREGHEALSLRRLAKDFDVTAPALYAYVETKEDLLRAVAISGFDDLAASFDDIDEVNPLDRIRSIAHAYVAFARANPELWRLMYLFPARLRPISGAESRGAGGRAFESAARSVFDAMSNGEMRLGDPWLTSIAFRSAIHGLTQLSLAGSDLSVDEEAAVLDIVVESMLRGLAPSPGALPPEHPSSEHLPSGRR
jgi:AcrR family transcriptional regulator